MGEGNPQTAGNSPQGIKRAGMYVGGTLVVLVAGLVLMQAFRSQTSEAAVESAGTAKLNSPSQRPALARVGKAVVPYEMVAEECVVRHGKEVLDDLINRMIIQQACEERNVVVTEEEVTAEVSRIAKRFNLDPQQWYSMLETERNITPMQYRQSVVWPMLALKKLAGEQVDLTEEEMNKAFVRNYGPRVKARLILLDNPRRARECWEKAAADPATFEKLAQEYSIDPNSRSLGGTIPPIPRYSGNETLELAAFKLQPGEISGIIEVQTGRYAILKCEGRTEKIVQDISEVRDSLYEELFEAKTQESVAKVFENIKKNTQIDNYLTQTSTGPNRPFTSANGIQQTSGQTPAAPVQGSPVNVRQPVGTAAGSRVTTPN